MSRMMGLPNRPRRVMWEIAEADPSRFHCHVGRIDEFGSGRNLRRLLASAMRGLDERAALARKLYHHAKNSGHRLLVEDWTEKVKEFERESQILRNSTRRTDRLAAQADMAKQSAAE